jgi:L-serine dehydratase
MATGEALSVFDMFKIGVGPSSSHTLGPWKAALHFLKENPHLEAVKKIEIDLYGSLAKTGIGHGTDIAVQMGLMGEQPDLFDVKTLQSKLKMIQSQNSLQLDGKFKVKFDPKSDIIFKKKRNTTLSSQCAKIHFFR